jgi:hypothetical protein
MFTAVLFSTSGKQYGITGVKSQAFAYQKCTLQVFSTGRGFGENKIVNIILVAFIPMSFKFNTSATS